MLYFNSRPYVRGDREILYREAKEILFQFTPLREGRRRCVREQDYSEKHFNSRPYVRGDLRLRLYHRGYQYFNSRPYVRGDRKN